MRTLPLMFALLTACSATTGTPPVTQPSSAPIADGIDWILACDTDVRTTDNEPTCHFTDSIDPQNHHGILYVKGQWDTAHLENPNGTVATRFDDVVWAQPVAIAGSDKRYIATGFTRSGWFETDVGKKSYVLVLYSNGFGGYEAPEQLRINTVITSHHRVNVRF